MFCILIETESWQEASVSLKMVFTNKNKGGKKKLMSIGS
jgi:hypothetical protein